MNDKPLSCTIKPPVSISAGLKTGSAQETVSTPGCKIIDISFPSIVNPEIGEIRFQNCYVAYLSIKVKLKSVPTPREGVTDHGWRFALRRFPLMSNPHTEEGSQDTFSLTSKHFCIELSNIVSVRLILQQPSPVWKDFKLEDLKVFRTSSGAKGHPLPSWVLEDDKSKVEKRKVEGEEVVQEEEQQTRFEKKTRSELAGMGAPELDLLSCNLQQLWALAEEAAASQTEDSLGRYEVDGCYDINLLAYS